jgi:hypothetical protein
MIRSVLAVFTGIVVLTIVSYAIEALANPLTLRLVPDALSDTAPLSHSLPARLFMMAYTIFSIALGGYVTAWIARRAQALHAVIMSAIVLALTAWEMFRLPHQAPRWSWIMGMILTVPAAWFGAKICARHPPRRTRWQVS